MNTKKAATTKQNVEAGKQYVEIDPATKGYAALLGRAAPSDEATPKKRGRPKKEQPGFPVLRSAIVLHLYTQARQGGKTERAARVEVVERALREYGIRLSPTAVQRVMSGLQPAGKLIEWERADGTTIAGVLITEVDAVTGEVRVRVGERPSYARETTPPAPFDFRKKARRSS